MGQRHMGGWTAAIKEAGDNNATVPPSGPAGLALLEIPSPGRVAERLREKPKSLKKEGGKGGPGPTGGLLFLLGS